MTRDELEMLLWRTGSLNLPQVQKILTAVDDYANYCEGITSARRAELEQALRKPRNRKETPCPKQASIPPPTGGPSPSTTHQAATRRGS